jgi:hypothetical protein
MEDLLVGCVCGTSDLDLTSSADILDVSDDYVSTLAFIIGILTTSDGGYVGGDACVDDDVLLTCVTVNV